MNKLFALLAIYNKPRLHFKEVCEVIGVSMPTGYNRGLNHTLPFHMAGDPLGADIRDVATYVDRMREEGKILADEWRCTSSYP